MEKTPFAQRDTAKLEQGLRTLFRGLTVFYAFWLVLHILLWMRGDAKPYDIASATTGLFLCGSYLPRSGVVRGLMVILTFVFLGLQFWLR